MYPRNCLFFIVSFISFSFAIAQDQVVEHNWSNNLFNSLDAFVENKGQYKAMQKELDRGNILFASMSPSLNAYFFKDGISFYISKPGEVKKVRRRLGMSKEEYQHEIKEAHEHVPNIVEKISLYWKNANKNVTIESSEKGSAYWMYNLKAKKGHDIKASGFKRLVYKDLYPGIDLEYTFHPDGGLKYQFIVHPGADPNQILYAYDGDTKLKTNKQGELEILRPNASLLDHAPKSWTEGTEQKIETSYNLKGNQLSFNVGLYNNSETLIIDPWIVNNFTVGGVDPIHVSKDDNNDAYVYLSNPSNSAFIQKYAGADGALIWTYDATTELSTTAAAKGDLQVDPVGNSYVTQGANQGTPYAFRLKLNTAGNLQWRTPTGGTFAPVSGMNENWTMAFSCDYSMLVQAGIGRNQGEGAKGILNTADGSENNVAGIANVGDLVSSTFAPNGLYYYIAASRINTGDGQAVLGCLDPAAGFAQVFNVRLANAANDYFLRDVPRANYGQVSINGLAANCDFLYVYDGSRIYKRNLMTGAIIAQTMVNNEFGVGCSGVDIDACGNVYVGSINQVRAFDSSLNPIRTYTVPERVFDIQMGNDGTFFACGAGFSNNRFLRQFNVAVECNDPLNIAFTTASCTDGGTATANPSFCSGPYTYLWSDGQTTKTATNLSPGSYTVTVTGANTCIGPVSGDVNIILVPNDSPLNAKDSIKACLGGEVEFTSTFNASYNYAWTGPNGFTNSSNNFFFTPSSLSDSGYYYLSISNPSDPCVQGMDSTYLSLEERPAVNIIPDTTICSSNSMLSVYAGGGITYQWLPSANYLSPNLSTTTINLSESDSVSVRIGFDICPDTLLSSFITVVNPLDSITPDTSICLGSTVQLSAFGASSYTWTPTNGLSSPNSASTAASPTLTTRYKVEGVLGQCTDSLFTTVTVFQPPNLSNFVLTETGCTTNDGSITINSVTGGLSPYQYSINGNNFQASNTFTGLAQGNYTLSIRDANGCSLDTIFNIKTADGPQSVDFTLTESGCTVSNGSITINSVTGGLSPYEYSLDGTTFQTSNTFTGLAQGNYTLSIRDANGCTLDTTFTISPGAGPTAIDYTLSESGCTVSNGSITINSVTGGLSPYEYSIDGTTFQTSNTFTGLAQGTYTLTVSDANGCTYSEMFTIATANGPTAVDYTLTQTACTTNDGSITINSVTDGISPYEYSIDGTTFQMSNTFTGLAQGTYTLTVRDANGCTYSEMFTISTVGGPSDFTTTVSDATCLSSDGSITIDNVVDGTPNYEYSIDGGAFQASNIFTALAQGTYNITVRDAKGCTTNKTIVVGSQQSITDFVADVSPEACNQSDGAIEIISVAGGDSPYEYSIDGGAFQMSNTFTALSQGTYSITVRDANGCLFSKNVVVTVSSGITDFDLQATHESCNQSNGSITVSNVMDGLSPYEYSIDGTTFQMSNIFAGLTQGTYTITARDANGCSYQKSITIDFIPGPSAADITSTDAGCTTAIGSITINSVSDGVSPYEYSIDGVAFQMSNTFTGLAQGTYNITVRDANGCTFTESVSIGTLPGPSVQIASSTDASCFGGNDGSATANATNGASPYTYSWNTSPIQTTATATNLNAGMYTVTATDANGCTASNNVSIGQATELQISVTTFPTDCQTDNGSATATVTGGIGAYTYSWNTTPVQTTATATGLGSNRPYILTVTDANGCSKDTSINIFTLNGPQISLASTTPVSCNNGSDGSISTQTTGGVTPYTFEWTDGSGATLNPPQTTGTATGLSPDTYRLVVTDAAGCKANFNQTLGNPPPINASFTIVDEPCGQGNGSISTTAFGGTGALSYAWSSISGSTLTGAQQSSQDLNNIAAGMYQLTVTDANMCSQQFTATVDAIARPQITNATVQDVMCQGGNDGSATVQVSSGTMPYAYSWNTTPVQTTATASGLTEGSYTCTVSDANNCQTSTSVTVGFQTAIPVFTLGPDVSFCQGDSVQIGATYSGGTYAWNTGQTTPFIYAKAGMQYMLTISDNGCSATDDIIVTEDMPPSLDIGADRTFCGMVDTTIDVSVSGSATYLWDDNSTNPIRNITQSGTFFVEITRGACTVYDTVSYDIQPGLLLTLPSDQVLCDGQSFVINPTLANSINPIYTWSTGESSSDITVTQTGTYTLTVSDGVCLATDSINVTFNAQPTVNLGNDTSLCEGDTLILNAGSANASYTKIWSTGESGNSISVTSNGTYSVNVQNQNCTATDEIDVVFEPAPVFNLAMDTAICIGDKINIGVQLSNASYQWTSSPQGLVANPNTPFIEINKQGNYTLSVTQNGCSSSRSHQLAINPLPIIDLAGAELCPIDTLSIDASCQGCTYLWENGDVTPIQTVVAPSKKQLNLTDANGCVSQKTLLFTENQDDDCDPGIYVPSSFTPNGDDINEVFVPVVRADVLDTYELSIYNRWGELIFKSTTVGEAWNGYYKGVLSKTDVFAWKLKYSYIYSVETKLIFGKVTLLK